MFDFIIVGSGLAGVSFANILEKYQKTFCIISDNSQIASLVAGGVFNPVVLKRFTPVWKANEQISTLYSFYKEMELKYAKKFLIKMPIFRKFSSVEEQNNWFQASDKPMLSDYLHSEIFSEFNQYISAPFGFGRVQETGVILIKDFLNKSLTHWKNEGVFHQRTFDYQSLEIKDNEVEYQGVLAKNIVFCEGYGVIRNPFFSYLPMKPCKGETLTFYAPDLNLEEMVKSDGLISPLDNGFYRIGATYQWEDLTDTITEKARNELIERLNKLISCSYELIHQEAAVRPTVSDRRPLVGKHTDYQNVWILNGLGTRGVMNAPYVSNILYEAVYEGKEIIPEININRYNKFRK